MRLIHIFLFVVFIIMGCKEEVREPAVSGRFYPSERDLLFKMVNTFIENAQYEPRNGRLIAVVSPHAGYQYSGSVAGYSYRHLREIDIDTVILIGPSHYTPFTGVSVYTDGIWRTPLGDVRINRRIAGSLINEKMNVISYKDAFFKEHSLEVQLPFLQVIFHKKRFTIVPVLTGNLTRESFEFLKDRLSEILNREKAVIIATSDLSHYHSHDEAVRMDKSLIDAMEGLSIEDMERLFYEKKAEACGMYPLVITVAIAREMGVKDVVLYKYATSGEITRDKSSVVGYASIGFYVSDFTHEEKRLLLRLARDAIVNYVKYKKIINPEIKNKRFVVNGATFVTIKDRNGLLRGCIGNIYPHMLLYQSVIKNAISASSYDPRFPPMRPDELEGMKVEVTILSPLRQVYDIEEIEIGRHGIYIVKDGKSGLLLPQVPVEYGWDRLRFLREVSIKAGLPTDSWNDARIYKFEAEIISE